MFEDKFPYFSDAAKGIKVITNVAQPIYLNYLGATGAQNYVQAGTTVGTLTGNFAMPDDGQENFMQIVFDTPYKDPETGDEYTHGYISEKADVQWDKTNATKVPQAPVAPPADEVLAPVVKKALPFIPLAVGAVVLMLLLKKKK